MNFRNFIKMSFIFGLFAQFQCDEKSNPIATYPDANREDKIPTDIEKRGTKNFEKYKIGYK